MLNLAVQLQALYEGRREDVGGLIKERESGGEGAVENGGKGDPKIVEGFAGGKGV